MVDETQNPVPAVDITPQTGTSSADTSAEEKVLKQSEVNRIVGTAKVDAFEKGRKAAFDDLQQQQQAEMSTRMNQPATETDKIVISKDELQRVVAEQAAQQAMTQEAEKLVSRFAGKITAGAHKHDDFDETVAALELPGIETTILDRLLRATDGVDNTADVVYELGKNPAKFANMLTLCRNNPRMAERECAKLSHSIKSNEDAQAKAGVNKANEPLDQLKPSTNGTDDGQPKSVSDLRKQSYLRG